MCLLDRLLHTSDSTHQRTVHDWVAVVDQHHRMVSALVTAQPQMPSSRRATPGAPRPSRSETL